MISTV